MQTWPELEKIERGRAGRGLVDVDVGQDDDRRFAAELQRHPLQRVGRGAVDDLADLGRAGEGDLVDVGMADQPVAGGLAKAGDDVEHAGREAGLGDQVGEAQRGQRGLLGGLQDDRAAGGERRRDLLHRHHQREVPRHDLGGDADRLAADISVDRAGRERRRARHARR